MATAPSARPRRRVAFGPPSTVHSHRRLSVQSVDGPHVVKDGSEDVLRRVRQTVRAVIFLARAQGVKFSADGIALDDLHSSKEDVSLREFDWAVPEDACVKRAIQLQTITEANETKDAAQAAAVEDTRFDRFSGMWALRTMLQCIPFLLVVVVMCLIRCRGCLRACMCCTVCVCARARADVRAR